MLTDEILIWLDEEIARLKQAHALLLPSISQTPSIGKDRAASKVAAPAKPSERKSMSAEARKRIGDAQRLRWAAQREPVVTVVPPRKSRERRQPKPLVHEPNALTSTVPLSPVVVSAAEAMQHHHTAPPATPQFPNWTNIRFGNP